VFSRNFIISVGCGCCVVYNFLSNEMGLEYHVMSQLRYLGGVRMLCLAATWLFRWGENDTFCVIFFLMRWA